MLVAANMTQEIKSTFVSVISSLTSAWTAALLSPVRCLWSARILKQLAAFWTIGGGVPQTHVGLWMDGESGQRKGCVKQRIPNHSNHLQSQGMQKVGKISKILIRFL